MKKKLLISLIVTLQLLSSCQAASVTQIESNKQEKKPDQQTETLKSIANLEQPTESSEPPTATPDPPTTTPTPTIEPSETLVDNDIACALYGVYALSCLDKDGWHVFEPNAIDDPQQQILSWLSHLPPRPWTTPHVPQFFPPWLAKCPGGRIYLFMGEKLYFFEGEKLVEIRFEKFGTEKFLTCGTENEIWVGYYDGVSHFDGSVWIHYPAREYLGKSEFVRLVKSIVVAPNGHVWVVTASSIATFDGVNWQVFEAGKGFEDNPSGESLTIDENGNVWVVNHKGLMKYDGVHWATFYEGAPKDISNSYNLIAANEAKIWVSTGNIYTFDPKTNHWTLQFSKKVLSGGLKNMQFDRRGRLWVVTSYGLDVYDGSGWIAYQMHTADLYSNLADAILIFGDGPGLTALTQKTPGSVHGKLVNSDSTVYAQKYVEICVGSVVFRYSGATPCAGRQSFNDLTIVDKNGDFEFLDVPVGKYNLFIEISNNSWADFGQFEINPGEKTEFGEIPYPP
jgi:hypothetical protein